MKYTVSCDDAHRHSIAIEYKISNNTEEQVVVNLPAWRPGRYELGNFAKNIQKWEAFDGKGNALVFKKINKDSWSIQTAKAAEIIIKYTYYAAELNAGSSYLDTTQLYINPVNCFMYVPNRMNEECVVELNVPENYKLAIGAKKISEHSFQTKSFDELADTPFIASDTLKRNKFVMDGVEVNLWFQGECKPDFSKLIRDFFIFVNEQFMMMKEFPTTEYHFLFQVLPYKFHHGVEHVTSTVIALGPSYNIMKGDAYLDLLGVSSHEFFHVWNIKSIRPAEMYPYDFSKENYSRLGYVCEGLTTYYGDYLLYRSGVFNEQEYADTFNEQLQKHFDNFGRFNLSVADSSFDTWLDGYTPGVPNRKVSIYTEGCLLAFITDITIRKQTNNAKSLDDVMRTLYFDFAKQGKGYTDNDYQQIIESLTGNSWKDFFASYVYGTKSLEELLKSSLAYLGLALSIKPTPLYNASYLGFKVLEQNNQTQVTAIYPNSVADKAGLAVGDKVVAVNGIEVINNLAEWCSYFASEKNIQITVVKDKIQSTLLVENNKELYYKQYSIHKVAEAFEEQKTNYYSWCKKRF